MAASCEGKKHPLLRAMERIRQNFCDRGCAGSGGMVSCRQNREPSVATTTRDMMKGRTAKAVAAVRAPISLEAPIFLITLVLLGLLTQAAWMHAT